MRILKLRSKVKLKNWGREKFWETGKVGFIGNLWKIGRTDVRACSSFMQKYAKSGAGVGDLQVCEKGDKLERIAPFWRFCAKSQN